MTDLTNTDTYYYINRENIKFDSDEERDNFIKRAINRINFQYINVLYIIITLNLYLFF